ncbi:protein jag [Argonema antarcticum]|uniref:Jag family protein n=1 Tax=Argonema antarcticum TaxID=2942763 RepID=UPI0020129B17|nr:R3H domain-containing nucleic acid-binding protein [Argonema antarcticum]MCL1469552.1 RNA-binding protein [Argonema antarcticum A004/B2]
MTDSRMQRGQKWLEELLRLMKIPAKVKPERQATLGEQEDVSEPEPDSYWLTIDHTHLTPAQVQILVGAEGGTLDAIQYLANAILNLGQEQEEQATYTVELNGYRVRREAELRALAEYAVQQVRANGQEFEMEYLSSAERRQIHTFLKEFTDLESYSRGKEPDRRLVVRRR